MRAITRLLPVLLAAAPLACGGSEAPHAPSPTALSLAVGFDPAQTGGIRPGTTVSALLYLESAPNTVVSGVVEKAEFTVFDAGGAVLAHETVAGPLAFDGALTVRQLLDWVPADVLGRSLTVRFVIAGGAGVERTATF